jgi:diguanylate cyclase (GGDEF)-like protein
MIQDFKNLTHLLRRMTARIPQNPDQLQELFTIAVCEIRRGLDIDLVQIYREDAKGSRQMVAESCRQDGFLSLLLGKQFPIINHYPTTAIPIDTFPKNNHFARQYLNGQSTTSHSAPARSALEIHSSASFPIRLSRQKWGYLKVARNRPHGFSFPERQLLQLLANQIAIGINQCDLRQQVQQQTQRHDTLDQISSLLRVPGGEDRNLQQVLEEILAALGSIGGRLYLQTEPTANPTCQLYTWGEQPSDPQLETRPSWQAWLSVIKTCKSLEKREWAVASHPSDLICIDHWTPFPTIIADFHAHGLPQPLSQVFASTSIGSILTISLDYGDRCMGYLSVFRAGKSAKNSAVSRRQVNSQKPRTPSWSTADISFIQSASLHLYLWLLSQQVQRTLDYQASHDLLTCLPNRKQFEVRLDRSLHCTRRGTDGLAVAVLDLDGFKRVNYTLGHPVGDRLLLEVTGRLQRQLPSSTCLARWGDDRFTFLIEYTSRLEELTHIVQTVLNTFCHPFHLENQEIYITASLGVAIAPNDGDNAPVLLKNAEIAMHQAKRFNKNSYQFYASEMNRSALAQLVLESDLRKASIRHEFWLDYQPQIDLTTGQIVCMEALIRWQHPTLGAMPPDSFIGLAEETGLICPMGEWVIRTACLQQRAWVREGIPPVRVAVNLSARQLQPDLVPMITKILHDTQMNPRDLELEITESVAVQNLEMTMVILQEFQDMGVTIALDDFGTGYSCLSAVEQLPLNVIKIDRSLVSGSTQNPRAAAIAKTVLALGRGLNLLVLAEGVETPEQVSFLKSIHCDLVQGNFFSSALSGDRAMEFLRNGSVFIGIERVKLTQF